MPKNVLLSKYRKDAKREQAIKQVKEAYALCEVGYYEDESGQKKEARYINIDGENYLWRIQMEPEMEDLYSTLDIVKALGIPRERLRDWLNRGFVKPSLPAYGQGTIAIFTFWDVLAVKLLDRLIGKGFKRELATEVSDQIFEYKVADVLQNLVLITVKRDGNFDLVVEHYSGAPSLKIEIDKKGRLNTPMGKKVGGWSDIQIINIAGLYKEVEAVLEKLG